MLHVSLQHRTCRVLTLALRGTSDVSTNVGGTTWSNREGAGDVPSEGAGGHEGSDVAAAAESVPPPADVTGASSVPGLGSSMAADVTGASEGGSIASLVSPEEAAAPSPVPSWRGSEASGAASADAAGAAVTSDAADVGGVVEGPFDVGTPGGPSEDAGAGTGGSQTALEQASKSLSLPADGPLLKKPVSCDASVSNNHTNAFFISSGCRMLSANARPSGFWDEEAMMEAGAMPFS